MNVCRETGEKDVQINILYCGICHTDLHCAKNEWGSSKYPIVPGYVYFLYADRELKFRAAVLMLLDSLTNNEI